MKSLFTPFLEPYNQVTALMFLVAIGLLYLWIWLFLKTFIFPELEKLEKGKAEREKMHGQIKREPAEKSGS